LTKAWKSKWSLDLEAL